MPYLFVKTAVTASILPLTTWKLAGEILERQGFVFLWQQKKTTKQAKTKQSHAKIICRFAGWPKTVRPALCHLTIKQVIKWGGKKREVETAWHTEVFHLKIYNQNNKLYKKIKPRMTFCIFFCCCCVKIFSFFPFFILKLNWSWMDFLSISASF